MTREEAINQLQDAKDGYKEYLTDEALDMAIKALEQEPVIDKIRAEIKKEIISENSYKFDYETIWQNKGLRMALKVIDKHKAECKE